MIFRRFAASRAAAVKLPRIRDGLRIYAIGDVHGCAGLLNRLLSIIASDIAANPDAAALLVFLGDYVDRGPDSKAIIDILSTGDLPAPASFLMGNHEDVLLSALKDPLVIDQWRQFGGVETLVSYGVDVSDIRIGRGYEKARDALLRKMPRHHLEFFASLQFSAEIDDYFFCHAGVRPGVELDRQNRQDLLWVREEFLNYTGAFSKIIVHGHTPSEEVVIRPNRIGVDTGAYLTGRLSAAVLCGSEQRVIDSRGHH